MSSNVSVHPTALLSVVDHYTRVARGTNKRVIGTLLGESRADGLHVMTSFAVPFEEDSKDPRIWFVDHNYHETMFDMFKKVNPKERVVGWYSTGPGIKACDLLIHELFRNYATEPVFLVIDVTAKDDLALPIKAYVSRNEEDRSFLHIPSCISALEAEEVGVEHLLRDIKNATASTLAVQVEERLRAVKVLARELGLITEYLDDVIKGALPQDNDIIGTLQSVVNNLGGCGLQFAKDPELAKAFNIEKNDSTMAIYLGSMLRTTLALHNLIDNKIKNKISSKPATAPIIPAIAE